MSDLEQEISRLQKHKEKLKSREEELLLKVSDSGDINDIKAANQILLEKGGGLTKEGPKSYIFDPTQVIDSLGYKSSPKKITYSILRQMAKEPITKAIIMQRTEQVAGFSRFVQDSKKSGWNIRKKIGKFEKNAGLLDKEMVEVEDIVNFMENCGAPKWKYYGDSFDSFLRKIVPDSLILDQCCFEVVTSLTGKPVEYHAVDGATCRLADSYLNEGTLTEEEMLNGYSPYFVQLRNGVVNAEFYPWEMCFGIRNPTTNIYNNGYGESELEGMMNIITWLLWSESYNASQFKNGSFPKGILQAKGLTNDRLQEFKQQWTAQLKGYSKAGGIPVMGADDVKWLPMQFNNQEMEYDRWIEFLIRLNCAHYKIAPEEIGFYNLGSSSVTYDGSAQYKLEYSKDKGLVPLLKFIEEKINKWIVYPYTKGKYEFYFSGLEADLEEKTIGLDLQRMQIDTLNEVRELRGKPPLPFGDIPMNPVYLQYMMQKQGQQQQAGMAGGGGSNENPFIQNGDFQGYLDQLNNNNPFTERAIKENPFAKGFVDYLDFLNNDKK